MPLFRQFFAAVICRYVSIASPSVVAHTRPMHKLIIFVLALLAASLSFGQNMQPLTANKQLLISQAQNWLSQQTGVPAKQIEIAAIDRRLRVPDCNSRFAISFPYASSQQTIKVECPGSKWQIIVAVKMRSSAQGLVFVRDMQINEPVGADDVEVKTFERPIKGFVASWESLDNQSLVKAVTAGDAVLKRYLAESALVYKLNREILRGEAVELADISKVTMSLPRTAPNQRFPIRLFDKSIAARDLRAGAIVSRRDLNVKQMVMMASTVLTRGQKLSPQNTELKAFYGKLPSDALLMASDLKQMEAIQRIRAGEVLRSSDVRPMTMVREGDSVVLNVGAGLLNISTTMIALEDGKLDQQISLLNPESNGRVRAVVSGPGEARGL